MGVRFRLRYIAEAIEKHGADRAKQEPSPWPIVTYRERARVFLVSGFAATIQSGKQREEKECANINLH